MAKKVTLKITSAGGGNYLVVVSGEGFIGAAPNAQVGVRIESYYQSLSPHELVTHL